MNGIIKKLKDNLGNIIFPVTPSQAVYMQDGQMNLDEKLTEQDNKIGNLSGLNTTNKTDLVGAINENNASLNNKTNKDNSEMINVQFPPVPYTKVNGDGTDETTKIKALITYAESLGKCTLFFPYTSNGYKITSSLDIDASKVNLLGNGTKILCQNLIGTYAIELHSSVDYTNMPKNIITVMKGFYLVGGTYASKFNGTGLLLGHTTNANCSNFMVENIAIEGFNKNIEFINNAWRINFVNIYSRWGGVYTNTGLLNMGENINFSNSMFCDSDVDISIGTGMFHFNRCSFDNITIRETGDCTLHFSQCHFENPASSSTGYRYLSIDSINGTAFIENSDIILNAPSGGGNFTKALFYVMDTNTSRGLHLSNLKLFQLSQYTPQIDDGNLLLVAGKGRVTFNSGYNSWINNMNYVVARATNKLHNGGAETNNTNGWTISGTGTAVIDSTDKQEGTYSFKLTAGVGQTVTFKQKVKVSGNQFYNLCYWNKRVMNGGNVVIKVNALAEDGTTVAGGYTSSSITSDATIWTIQRGITGIMPVGASYAEISWIVTGGSGSTVVQLDDILFDSI